MMTHNMPMSRQFGIKSVNMPQTAKSRKEGTSFCMNCGSQLAYCGKPFSADISCGKCGAVHTFEESQQPTRFHLPVTRAL